MDNHSNSPRLFGPENTPPLRNGHCTSGAYCLVNLRLCESVASSVFHSDNLQSENVIVGFRAAAVCDDEFVTSTPNNLPEQLTLDEAFRAAFYMIRKYADLEKEPNTTLTLLLQYLWTDPARWEDWQSAVSRALVDGDLAD